MDLRMENDSSIDLPVCSECTVAGRKLDENLMIVAGLIGVVLLQKSEGGGLGIGNTGGFLTSRGTANVLTRATAFPAAAFFTTSILLTRLAQHSAPSRSIFDGAPGATSPATTAPGAVPAPATAPPN